MTLANVVNNALVYLVDLLEWSRSIQDALARYATTKTHDASVSPFSQLSSIHRPVPEAPVRSAEEERLAKFVELVADAQRVGLPPGRTTEQALLMALTTWRYQTTKEVVSYDLKARRYRAGNTNSIEADALHESDICVLRPHPTYKDLYITAGNLLRPEDSECSICRIPFSDGDEVIIHRICCYGFHQQCLMSWFQHAARPQCPLDNQTLAGRPQIDAASEQNAQVTQTRQQVQTQAPPAQVAQIVQEQTPQPAGARNHRSAQRNTVGNRAIRARGPNAPVGDRRSPRVALHERPARVLAIVRDRTRVGNRQTASVGQLQHTARNRNPAAVGRWQDAARNAGYQNQMRPQWR